MNRILIFSALILSFLSIQAQSPNSQAELQALTQKVDSLDHELAYLKVTYELNSLSSDMTMLKNEIYSRAIGIKLDIRAQDFDSRIDNMNQELYDSFKNQIDSFHKLADAKKEYFFAMTTKHSFSESELRILTMGRERINLQFDQLEKTMNLFKTVVDYYSFKMHH